MNTVYIEDETKRCGFVTKQISNETVLDRCVLESYFPAWLYVKNEAGEVILKRF